ncbi:MAG: hypothetical protein ACRD7E_16670, partial [Bryobacteraceae bacterium]
RFYSTERNAWEEIPLSLIDLKRTEEERKEREAERKEEIAILDAENKADRELREEIARIPYEPGVFQVAGDHVATLKQAESKIVNNKRRSILKAISPIPIVAGKATIEIDGTKSDYVVTNGRPEFYIRLAQDERFGIVRLTLEKNSRIVQKWSIVPVSKEIIEESQEVEVFRRQMADRLYKVWPTQPLEPGEYAVVEYTQGEGNVQVWDFSYGNASAAGEKKKEKKREEKKEKAGREDQPARKQE